MKTIRRLFATVLVVLTVLIGTGLNFVTPAIAADKIDSNAGGYFRPQATESQQARLKVQQAPSDVSDSDENAAYENHIRSSVRNPGDSVRDKLNLDEPIYPGTKEFINDVKETVSDTVEGAKNVLTGAGDRAENIVDNTKDAVSGVGNDVRNTVDKSFDRVH